HRRCRYASPGSHGATPPVPPRKAAACRHDMLCSGPGQGKTLRTPVACMAAFAGDEPIVSARNAGCLLVAGRVVEVVAAGFCRRQRGLYDLGAMARLPFGG